MKMPASTATYAMNSVVLNEALVSVERGIRTFPSAVGRLTRWPRTPGVVADMSFLRRREERLRSTRRHVRPSRSRVKNKAALPHGRYPTAQTTQAAGGSRRLLYNSGSGASRNAWLAPRAVRIRSSLDRPAEARPLGELRGPG